MNDLNEKNEDLKQEIKDLKEKNKNLQKEITDFNENSKHEIADLHKQNEDLLQKITDLNTRNKDLQQKITDLNEKNEDLLQKYTYNIKALEVSEKKIQEFVKNLQEKTDFIKILEDNVSSLTLKLQKENENSKELILSNEFISDSNSGSND